MKKDKLIQVRVSEEQKREIEEFAHKKRLNISELVLFGIMRLMAEDNLIGS